MDTDNDRGVERFSKILQEMDRPSDRGGVIVAASHIDSLLRDLLIASLQPSDTKDDELFDENRPLSAFSARITMACRLGLIDRDFKNALNLIRKLRNACAHDPDVFHLNKSPHRERLRELQRLFKGTVIEEVMTDVVKRRAWDSPEVTRFKVIASDIALRLDDAILSAAPPSGVRADIVKLAPR